MCGFCKHGQEGQFYVKYICTNSRSVMFQRLSKYSWKKQPETNQSSPSTSQNDTLLYTKKLLEETNLLLRSRDANPEIEKHISKALGSIERILDCSDS